MNDVMMNSDSNASMFSVVERFYPESEFMDAYWLSRDGTEHIINGNEKDALDYLGRVYAKLRFIFECYNRYLFASSFIDEDDTVLDVPCGIGYGTDTLARFCKLVYGMDINRESIDFARSRYNRDDVIFMCRDMIDSTMPAVDVIVCIEGIEHVDPDDGVVLIEKFAGHLNHGGRLIISNPINETALNPGVVNRYHKAEYDVDEFYQLLSKYFETIFMFGVDIKGSISDIRNAFNGIIAVCEA